MESEGERGNGSTASPGSLQGLDGQPLGHYTLRLKNLVQLSNVEQRNFDLYLENRHGRLSHHPIFNGTHSTGGPSPTSAGWIDGVFFDRVTFPKANGQEEEQSNLSEFDLDGQLFEILGDLIPPNGRLWVAYETFVREGRIHRETQQAIKRGVPLVATPLGYLLFRGDCWLNIRNWYIPEGGREGHQKLQGNKALHAEHRRKRAKESIEELETFLTQDEEELSEIELTAHERAVKVLEALDSYVDA